MVTHLVFGIGTAVALGTALPADVRLALAVVLSLAVNMAMDELGHVNRRGLSHRSALTHSVMTGPIWGGAIGYLAWLGWYQLGSGAGAFEWWFVILGAAVAGSHLLLDSMTEGGVFLLRHRVALAHFRSRNSALNGAFVILGVALVLAWPPG